MDSEPGFRRDLYRGTAAYYDRFRPPYPEQLVDDLCRRLPVSGGGRLLDLACGTGQVALPLARRFAEVWAVDQEDELVAYGRAKTARLGIGHVSWAQGSAEDVELDGPFELVTVGNAFHRFDRATVAERMRSWVQPGGGVALVWGDTPERGPEPWQRAMADLLVTWTARVGATDRVPAGWRAAIERDPHEQVLRRAGFDHVGRFEFTAERTWSVESLTGYVYSTSYLGRDALGEDAADFERELAELLARVEPRGVLRETASFAYELARAPA